MCVCAHNHQHIHVLRISPSVIAPNQPHGHRGSGVRAPLPRSGSCGNVNVVTVEDYRCCPGQGFVRTHENVYVYSCSVISKIFENDSEEDQNVTHADLCRVSSLMKAGR